MTRTKKTLPPAKSFPPNKTCAFCGTDTVQLESLGEIYVYKQYAVHYFCLLLASKVKQEGTDDEGILGFKVKDIKAELTRGANVACTYCNKNGATIYCAKVRCRIVFHLPCGRANGTTHQFFGRFASYCTNHKIKQPLTKKIRNSLEPFECSLCNHQVNLELDEYIWPTCCKVNSLIHKTCTQLYALNAGYYMKCPFCCNKNDFCTGLRKYGIFIPDRDAAWEREANAFQELITPARECEAYICKCPKGRVHCSEARDNKNEEIRRWFIEPCKSCGAYGIHLGCTKRKISPENYECKGCIAVGRRLAKGIRYADFENTNVDHQNESLPPLEMKKGKSGSLNSSADEANKQPHETSGNEKKNSIETDTSSHQQPQYDNISAPQYGRSNGELVIISDSEDDDVQFDSSGPIPWPKPDPDQISLLQQRMLRRLARRSRGTSRHSSTPVNSQKEPSEEMGKVSFTCSIEQLPPAYVENVNNDDLAKQVYDKVKSGISTSVGVSNIRRGDAALSNGEDKVITIDSSDSESELFSSNGKIDMKKNLNLKTPLGGHFLRFPVLVNQPSDLSPVESKKKGKRKKKRLIFSRQKRKKLTDINMKSPLVSCETHPKSPSPIIQKPNCSESSTDVNSPICEKELDDNASINKRKIPKKGILKVHTSLFNIHKRKTTDSIINDGREIEGSLQRKKKEETTHENLVPICREQSLESPYSELFCGKRNKLLNPADLNKASESKMEKMKHMNVALSNLTKNEDKICKYGRKNSADKMNGRIIGTKDPACLSSNNSLIVSCESIVEDRMPSTDNGNEDSQMCNAEEENKRYIEHSFSNTTDETSVHVNKSLGLKENYELSNSISVKETEVTQEVMGKDFSTGRSTFKVSVPRSCNEHFENSDCSSFCENHNKIVTPFLTKDINVEINERKLNNLKQNSCDEKVLSHTHEVLEDGLSDPKDILLAKELSKQAGRKMDVNEDCLIPQAPDKVSIVNEDISQMKFKFNTFTSPISEKQSLVGGENLCNSVNKNDLEESGVTMLHTKENENLVSKPDGEFLDSHFINDLSKPLLNYIDSFKTKDTTISNNNSLKDEQLSSDLILKNTNSKYDSRVSLKISKSNNNLRKYRNLTEDNDNQAIKNNNRNVVPSESKVEKHGHSKENESEQIIEKNQKIATKCSNTSALKEVRRNSEYKKVPIKEEGTSNKRRCSKSPSGILRKKNKLLPSCVKNKPLQKELNNSQEKHIRKPLIADFVSKVSLSSHLLLKDDSLSEVYKEDSPERCSSSSSHLYSKKDMNVPGNEYLSFPFLSTESCNAEVSDEQVSTKVSNEADIESIVEERSPLKKIEVSEKNQLPLNILKSGNIHSDINECATSVEVHIPHSHPITCGMSLIDNKSENESVSEVSEDGNLKAKASFKEMIPWYRNCTTACQTCDNSEHFLSQRLIEKIEEKEELPEHLDLRNIKIAEASSNKVLVKELVKMSEGTSSENDAILLLCSGEAHQNKRDRNSQNCIQNDNLIEEQFEKSGSNTIEDCLNKDLDKLSDEKSPVSDGIYLPYLGGVQQNEREENFQNCIQSDVLIEQQFGKSYSDIFATNNGTFTDLNSDLNCTSTFISETSNDRDIGSGSLIDKNVNSEKSLMQLNDLTENNLGQFNSNPDSENDCSGVQLNEITSSGIEPDGSGKGTPCTKLNDDNLSDRKLVSSSDVSTTSRYSENNSFFNPSYKKVSNVRHTTPSSSFIYKNNRVNPPWYLHMPMLIRIIKQNGPKQDSFHRKVLLPEREILRPEQVGFIRHYFRNAFLFKNPKTAVIYTDCYGCKYSQLFSENIPRCIKQIHIFKEDGNLSNYLSSILNDIKRIGIMVPHVFLIISSSANVPCNKEVFNLLESLTSIKNVSLVVTTIPRYNSAIHKFNKELCSFSKKLNFQIWDINKVLFKRTNS